TGGTPLAAGITLSIAPGTALEMGPHAYMNVQGALTARGEASAPIIFTGASMQPTPGSWGCLQCAGSGTVGSVLDHVQLFYGSNASAGGGMLTLISGANITVANSVFAQGS